MSELQDDPKNQITVEAFDSAEAPIAPEKSRSLMERYRELYGIQIKIRSNSPAVDEMLAAGKPVVDGSPEKLYDEGGPYDKIYQRYDKA